MKKPIYEVIVGESLPDLSLWVTVTGKLLTDLGFDATFSLLVRNADDTDTLFFKTTGFTGQVGHGKQNDTDGVPNLVISWQNFGELVLLAPDRTHNALLTITRTSDSKIRYYEFVIRAMKRTGT